MDAPRRAAEATPAVATRAILVVIAALGVVWLLYQISGVLLLAFLAIIIAAGALGPAAWLEGRGLPRPAAVLLVYAGVVGAVALLLLLIVPALISELVDLATQLPDLARELLDRYQPELQSLGAPTDASGLVDAVLGSPGEIARSLSSVPLAVATTVANLATIIFLSAILLLERSRARAWLLRFVGPNDRDTVVDLADKAIERLGAYVRGQLLIMTFTGVASGVGLAIIGVPFALPLGFLAFLTEAIPLAGPILAGAVMVAVALVESPEQAIAVIVLVTAIQQLEGLVLVPMVQGRVISISPAVALLAVLSGSAIGGIGGALIAIPVVAIATVVIDEVILPWRRRQIERERRRSSTSADAAG